MCGFRIRYGQRSTVKKTTRSRVLQKRHNALRIKHIALQTNYNVLETRFNHLEASYSDLRVRYSHLYFDIETKISNLQTQVSDLENIRDSNLEAQVSDLENKHEPAMTTLPLPILPGGWLAQNDFRATGTLSAATQRNIEPVGAYFLAHARRVSPATNAKIL